MVSRPDNEPPPASPQWIAGRIETLLSHYFQPGTDERIAEAAMTDWIRLLSSMPQQAISFACDRYMANQPRRRPGPGDILCIAQTWLNDQRKQYMRKLPPPTEEKRERVSKERAAEILKEYGFTSAKMANRLKPMQPNPDKWKDAMPRQETMERKKC